MINNSENHPDSGLRRKYSKFSLVEVSFEPKGFVLQTSTKLESVDVSVELFDDVQDVDNNDFFKVEFE